MFDPTVFDNLKVAVENEFYDLDNLDRIIDITNRRDLLDMAVMSRPMVENDRTPDLGPVRYDTDDRLCRREIVGIHERKHQVFRGKA